MLVQNPNSKESTSTAKQSVSSVGIFSSLHTAATSVQDLVHQFLQGCNHRIETRNRFKIQQRAAWSQGITDRIFSFLDYDPTDAESGESAKPNLIAALAQWIYRTIWTQRIELGGLLFVIIVGLVCYSCVAGS